MMYIKQKLAGYTLLEVLIAIVIFSVLMMVVTNVVMQNSSYQAKIASVKSAADEAKMISEMISEDIRNATGSGTVQIGTIPAKSFPGGIALVKYAQTSVLTGSFKRFDLISIAAAPSPATDANVLILFLANETKIYYTKTIVGSPKKQIFLTKLTGAYKSAVSLALNNDTYLIDTIPVADKTTIILNSNPEYFYDSIGFSGIALEGTVAAASKQQSFVTMNITVQHLGSKSTVAKDSVVEVKTSVASRKYNP
jgi:prepilin-type N-terminal cleavage/methylation domain-containing protein